MKTEFYRMEYEAWDEGTEDLTLEEEAAYLRACHQMYRRRGPIPNRIATLSRLWRCHSNKARKVLDRLLETGKLQVTSDGQLTNNRVGKELVHRELVSRQRADSGRIGGERVRDRLRKANEINGGDEANASRLPGDSRAIRGEERREEEKREEKKEVVSSQAVERTAQPELSSEPASPSRDDDAYAFENGCIRINSRDLNRLKRTFSAINVEATLARRAEWINDQAKAGKNWFFLCQSILGKANEESERNLAGIKAKAEAEATLQSKPRRSLV